MTEEQILLFYILKNCLVIPNKFATQIYPEGDISQTIAVLFKNMIVFNTSEGNEAFKLEDLTEDFLMKMYNEFLMIEKKKKIKQRKQELETDFK